MTDDRPIRADAHDIPDEDAGPDTPKRFDDSGTAAARNLPPGDEPAEGRRDIPEDQTQPRDQR
jgi:hypothetical protein